MLRYGESRLSRVSTDTTRPAATRARCVELWTRPGVEVTAPFGGILTVDTDPGGGAGAVEVRDAGCRAADRGLFVETAPEHSVHPGASARSRRRARTGTRPPGDHCCLRGAAADAAFTDAEGEAETPGAADPSVILGTDQQCGRSGAGDAARPTGVRGGDGAAAERFYAEPPQIERGWGALLIDTQGRAYVDLVNNVTAIGHAHPVFADRIARQLHLLNTNSRFLYDAFAEFTARLVAHSPDPSLDTVIPVNKGRRPDLALTLARVATGRRDVIAVRESYHGWTSAPTRSAPRRSTTRTPPTRAPTGCIWPTPRTPTAAVTADRMPGPPTRARSPTSRAPWPTRAARPAPSSASRCSATPAASSRRPDISRPSPTRRCARTAAW